MVQHNVILDLEEAHYLTDLCNLFYNYKPSTSHPSQSFWLVEPKIACYFILHSGDEIGIRSYGPGNGRIWISDVQCTGSEESIEDCSFVWGQPTFCNHAQDVGLNCGPVNESGKVYLEYRLTIQV